MWMLAGLAWLGGLISMISESLGEILTTMRVGPIVLGPTKTTSQCNSEVQLLDHELTDIPEGNISCTELQKIKQNLKNKNGF